MQDIKGSSSTWINDNRLVKGKFAWQAGYGAFSYSHSQINRVDQYINSQEKHHQKHTFQEEYMQLLEKFDIAFDKKYILTDVE